jgi:hypothetical protein
MRIPRFGLAVLCMALGGPAAAAVDLTLNDFRFQESILGEKVEGQALKGKVVLVEFWGIK